MSSNLIVTLLGLLTVAAVTANIRNSVQLKENWNLGYPISTVGQSVIKTKNGLSAAPSNASMYKNVGSINRQRTASVTNLQAPVSRSRENFQQNRKNPNGFMTVPGEYQSPLSPRFSNTQYGSNITYNLPQRNKLAVPRNPLSMANTVERYTPKVRKSDMKHSNASPENDMLPTQDMDGSLVGPGPQNPILYHNLIWASKKSRTYRYGDPIRGDLPIVPCTDHKNRWFIPSANPSTALNTGAMNVMGGYDNTTAQQLGSLTAAANLGSDLSAGGINVPSDIEGTAIGQYAASKAASTVMTPGRGMNVYGSTDGRRPGNSVAVSSFPA